MSTIGTCEYVIGIIHDKEAWYYVGEPEDYEGVYRGLESRFSSYLADAKRYDDEESIQDDLLKLGPSITRMILEIQKCPKCGKEFTEHPALSREDNQTEICPECGVREAIESFSQSQI